MTILNQDIADIRALSEDEKSILFAILDKDGNDSIDLNEFLEFGSVLLIKLAKKSDYDTFVQTHLPSIFASDFYQALCKAVKSKRFEHVIEIVLVLNGIQVAVQDYPQLAGQNVEQDPGGMNTLWETVETVFTVVYVIEAMLKIMVNGWKRYIEVPKNCFDFFITVMVVLASVYVYCE